MITFISPLKFILLFYIVLLSNRLAGQMLFDTLELKEVEIISRREHIPTGIVTCQIDSVDLQNHSNLSLTELLTDNTAIYLKSYGNGSLASISMRGTAASHTTVLWNDIPINSPMPGQVDFYSLPVSFTDKVMIRPGTASTFQTYGGIGGTINFDNMTNWKEKTKIELSQDIASFGTYRTFTTLKFGNGKITSGTRLFLATSDNDFKYKNTAVNAENPTTETRQGAGYEQLGALQEVSLKTGKHGILSAKLWAQVNDRNVPPNLLTSAPDNNESLNENFIRGLIGYDRTGESTDITFRSAVLYNNFNYKNRTALIDTRNHITSLVNSGAVAHNFNKNLSIRFTGDYAFHMVNSDNYESGRQRGEGSVSIQPSYNLNDRLYFQLLFRQGITDNKLSPFVPAIAVAIRPIAANELLLRINASRNFHAPTLNDLYWNPGGNPELSDEKSTTFELGAGYKYSNPVVKIKPDLQVYHSVTDNWIVWQPDSLSAFWTPSNLKQVTTNGMEASLNFDARISNAGLNYDIQYALTRATNRKAISAWDMSEGKQLPYVPEHVLRQTLRIIYKSLATGYTLNYSGKRFTTSDNTEYLPAYLLHDIRITLNLVSGRSIFTIQLAVCNLTNVSYQAISWQPMPGRNYCISIKYNFSKYQ